MTLHFAERLPAGRVRLRFELHGEILERLRGFYRSIKDGVRYAATQFEAADARRAFACFDEPEFKARFSITLIGGSLHSRGTLSRSSLLHAEFGWPMMSRSALICRPGR